MVKQISDETLKCRIAEHILSALPDWFGIPENTARYVTESAHMPFWAYYNDESPVGFLALKEHGTYTMEIAVMGVLMEYHRKGIGRLLFDAALSYCQEHGYEFMQVKTVDAGYYDEYDKTRMFYESMGFKKLEVFRTLWDKWNPCLVMVMNVNQEGMVHHI
ncbi:N-acetyltransferase [Clostridia bacterium]|nr:N-acetyltransferase [Clostridia bacterium]